jgi:hypothetical protein
METLVWTQENIKKSRSPFSIYFYLKKNNGDYNSAKKLYDDFLKEKSPFRNPKNRPNTIEYWTSRGYTETDALLEISKIQSKPLDLTHYVEKYGEQLGLEKYNKRKANSQNRFQTEIKNIQSSLKCDYATAYDMVCNRKRKCSPRTIDYWINKGFSIEKSKELLSKYQKENSPRSVYYWIKHGYSEDDAHIKVREYQDNISIDSIMKRYSCDKEDALKLQESIIEKVKFTRIENKTSISTINDYEYFVYKKMVNKETKKTLKMNKKTFFKKNKDDSLDHRYSIFWGFCNDVPAEIIGSIYNLEYISLSENCKKQANCSIDLKTLLEMYENGN